MKVFHDVDFHVELPDLVPCGCFHLLLYHPSTLRSSTSFLVPWEPHGHVAWLHTIVLLTLYPFGLMPSGGTKRYKISTPLEPGQIAPESLSRQCTQYEEMVGPLRFFPTWRPDSSGGDCGDRVFSELDEHFNTMTKWHAETRCREISRQFSLLVGARETSCPLDYRLR